MWASEEFDVCAGLHAHKYTARQAQHTCTREASQARGHAWLPPGSPARRVIVAAISDATLRGGVPAAGCSHGSESEPAWHGDAAVQAARCTAQAVQLPGATTSLTSGLPILNAMMLFTVADAMLSSASCVRNALCGVTSTCARVQSGGGGGGPASVTRGESLRAGSSQSSSRSLQLQCRLQRACHPKIRACTHTYMCKWAHTCMRACTHARMLAGHGRAGHGPGPACG